MSSSRIHLSEHFTNGKLLRFTLPSIAMNIFASLYIVVDGFFVANFAGKSEFAAVTLIFPILNILGTIGYMFGVGGNALVAKTLGENKQERANRLFSLIVLTSSCVGFLLMVLGFVFMPQIAGLLGAEGKLLENSVLYGRIFILALPAWIWVYEFQLFFVAAEKPRMGLLVTVITGLANVALDALFLIVFKWGLAGAAAASAITQMVGGVFPLIYFSRKNDSALKLTKPLWDGKALVRCCVNGSSEFMEEAAGSFVGLFYNVQLLKYAGEDGVVVYGLLMYLSLIFSAIFVFQRDRTGCELPLWGSESLGAQESANKEPENHRSGFPCHVRPFRIAGASVFRFVPAGRGAVALGCRPCIPHFLFRLPVHGYGGFRIGLFYLTWQRAGIGPDSLFADLCV